MAVKIRLQRKGRKQRPYYHIVVADARSPRDGKYIENIGMYNPLTKPATIDLDRDAAYDWLMKGAQPTDTARAILRFKGVMYKKHLQRGVSKGAMTQEQADAKLAEWTEAKEAKLAERVAKSEAEKAAFHEMVSGTPPPPPAPTAEEKAAADDAPKAEEHKTLAEIAEEKAAAEEAAAEAPATEEAPAEEPAAEAKEEAPAEEPAAEAKEEAPAEEPAAEEEKKDEAGK